MRLIEGAVEARDTDPLVESLQDEIRELRQSLSRAEAETVRARREAARSVAELRRQLKPLYSALQLVFGELDTIGGEDAAPTTSTRTSAVWDAWKSKLGPSCGRIIDALLLHGEMNTTQLAIAAQMSKRNVPNVIYKLNQASLLNKNGGKFSLKQL